MTPEQEAAVVEAVARAICGYVPLVDLHNAALAAIAAYTRALEGIGWRLVPVEPTGEMKDAGASTYIDPAGSPYGTIDGQPSKAWRAMIAAAPPQRDDAK